MAKLRYLLGRRLVREDRYAEAGQYLRPPYDKILEKYVKALHDGADNKLPNLTALAPCSPRRGWRVTMGWS